MSQAVTWQTAIDGVRGCLVLNKRCSTSLRYLINTVIRFYFINVTGSEDTHEGPGELCGIQIGSGARG